MHGSCSSAQPPEPPWWRCLCGLILWGGRRGGRNGGRAAHILPQPLPFSPVPGLLVEVMLCWSEHCWSWQPDPAAQIPADGILELMLGSQQCRRAVAGGRAHARQSAQCHGLGLSASISAEECSGSVCAPPRTRQPVMLNGHKLQPKLGEGPAGPCMCTCRCPWLSLQQELGRMRRGLKGGC